jgi:hypothetical protein
MRWNLPATPIIGESRLLFRQLLADNPSHPTNLTLITKAGPVAVPYDPASLQKSPTTYEYTKIKPHSARFYRPNPT